ncbi:glycosyltransferase family 4 protein [Aquimarina agarilytica]|uniref:glycosyltransferase family 4 protein n=1 Tax=Aquimarina agarilytica TaxID=1087449 RepID=UPI000289CE1B|nr:glycosyltransferase family 4 protein [Aquimarina agarilytica]
MKKVLFILHLPPPVHGSAMVGKFIKDSHLINASFNTSYINLGTSKSIDEIGKSPVKKIGIYLKIIFQVVYQLIFNRPNIAYLAITAKGVGFYKDFLLVLIIKLLGVKLVLHHHNKGVSDYQHRFLDNLLYKITYKNTSVILISKHLYYDVSKYVKREHVNYCANGIPKMEFKSISENNEKGIIQLLFLSNLIESKGVYVLLQALKILKERKLKFFCTFIGGEGDITAEMFNERIAELDIKSSVVYKGKRYGEEKEKAFTNADIFVFPTYNDVFGLVNLEAMQFSLPIVSTLEGGIPEIVADGTTGFLVEPNDVYDLVNKIEILIKDSELREKMGKEGRTRYEEKFTLEKFEHTFQHILKKIAL